MGDSMSETSDHAPRCTSCRAALQDHEMGRQGCLLCQQVAERRLLRLSGPDGLYAALSGALVPSQGSGGPVVSGSRTRSLGVSMATLELQSSSSGIPALLCSWVRDWYRLMGRPVPARPGTTAQQQVDAAVASLRWHLEWACTSHPAWAEFSSELASAVASCRRALGEWEDPRPAVGACTARLEDGTVCGGVLRYDQDANATRCGGCRAAAEVDWRAMRKAVRDAAGSDLRNSLSEC